MWRIVDKHCSTKEDTIKYLKTAGQYATSELFGYLSWEFKYDRDIIKLFVKNAPYMLEQFALYKNDKEIVKCAVETNGKALLYASEELQCDKELVLIALYNTSKLYYYLPECIQKNEDIAEALVKKHPHAIEYLDPSVKNRVVYLLSTRNCSQRTWENIPIYYRNDRTFVLKALKNNGANYVFIMKFQQEREMLITAMITFLCALEYAPTKFKYDPKLLFNGDEIILDDEHIPKLLLDYNRKQLGEQWCIKRHFSNGF